MCEKASYELPYGLKNQPGRASGPVEGLLNLMAITEEE
jgi:predicted trehalose synthase